MSVTITVSEQVARYLEEMPGNGSKSPDEKLRLLIINEYHRRLARYRLTDERLSSKYGMTFAEFEQRNLIEAEDHTWEIDQDSIAWETAIDGIETLQRQINAFQSSAE